MMHVHRIDVGSEKTLILIHGIAGKCEQLSSFYAVGCNILSVDLPGHGKSKTPTSDVWETTITELLELLTTVEKPVVLGYSLGGLLACELLERGAQMEHLILLASAARLPMGDTLKKSHLMEKAEEFTKRYQDHIVSLIDWYRTFRSMHFSIEDDADLLTDLALTKALMRKDYRETLAATTTAITLIHGTKDLLIPLLFAAEIKKAVPQATFVELPENHVSISESEQAVETVKKIVLS